MITNESLSFYTGKQVITRKAGELGQNDYVLNGQSVALDYTFAENVSTFSAWIFSSGTCRLFHEETNGDVVEVPNLGSEGNARFAVIPDKFVLVIYSVNASVTMKTTLLDFNNVELQASTTTPTTTPDDAQKAADKTALAEIAVKLKAGISVSDDDLIFYKLKDSTLAKEAMRILDNCGNYQDLRNAGLTDGNAIDALGIYNVKIEPTKYESEKAIELIESDKVLLSSFFTFLHNHDLTFPDLTSLYQQMRANNGVYTALREWNKARTV